MRSRFDEQLKLLNRKMTEMGGECESIIASAVKALLEGSAAGEESKGGLPISEVYPTAEAALRMPNVRVRGLMTIPPVCADPRESRPYFEKVRALSVDINEKLFHNELEYLSMGMSGDFEEAIRAGATMVRVGTAIFGARNYGAAT